jgi:Ca2+-binding EF-hand superfamily protein
VPDVDTCGLEEEQVKSLKRTFDQFDSDKSGAISVGTVNTILKMMGMHVSTVALEEIIEEIDEDGSGELEFAEFIQLAAKFLIEEDEEEMKWELREAFRLYDKQGNGYITTNTLKEILREIDSTLNEHNLDQIVDEVDEDGSGTIDFDEFMAMMTGE